MSTPAIFETKPRRRWLSPRFSLQVLFLMVTAAAIGSAYWWRLPVTVTTEVTKGKRIFRETFTYHRDLKGNLIKHGVHRATITGGLDLEEYYQEGVLHGPFRNSYSHGGSTTGQFYLGEKDGTWKYEMVKTDYPLEIIRMEESWSRGKREGFFQRWDHTGKLCLSFEFKNDRLVASMNSPSGTLLVKRVVDGTLKDQALEHSLFHRVDFDYPDTPLREVIEDLHERFQIPLAPRWRRKTVALNPPPEPGVAQQPEMHEIPFSEDLILLESNDPKAAPQLVDMRSRSLPKPAPPPPVVKEIHLAPVRVDVRGVPLLAGYDEVLSPLGLVVDYRCGLLCIVDAEGAAAWRDATGVNDLHPAKDSSLANRLDAPAQVTCLEPLREVLRNLAKDQDIAVELRLSRDLNEVPGDELVRLIWSAVMIRNDLTTSPKKPVPLTLRQLLGLILDQANLHCHEENGVLIIEPPLMGK